MKHSQVQKAIQKAHAFVWVEWGKTFRDATALEAIAMRNESASRQDGLIYWVEGKDGKLVAKPLLAELPGLTYQPNASSIAATRQGYRLAVEANQFIESLP